MSSSRAVFVLVAVGIAALSIACEDDATSGTSSGSSSGGSSGSAPPGTTPPPPGAAGDFCQKTLGTVVAALEACCTTEDKATDDYGFVHGVVSGLLPGCQTTLDESIAKGRLTMRQAQVDACYAAYEATYGQGKCSNITNTFSDPSGTSCREAFTGTGAEGAPCAGDHECVDGLTCVGYMKAADGKCMRPPAVGEPCGPGRSDGGLTDTPGSIEVGFGTHPSCAPGARCDVSAGKCVQAAADGEDCASDDACAPPLACVMGKCASARAGEGAPCLATDECTPDCFCEGATGAAPGKCTKKRTAGAECTGAAFVSECIGRCDAEFGQPGTCKSFCGSP